MVKGNLVKISNSELLNKYRLLYGNDFIFDIDERDEMYTHLIRTQASQETPAQYFECGENMLKNVEEILERTNNNFQQVEDFLDFASGYGRFTRFLIMRCEPEAVTVSDINKDAVDFCMQTFHTNGFYSTRNPYKLPHMKEYDIIFTASLFSHLSYSLWQAWLIRLYTMLKPNGILIFSTHGPGVLSLLKDTRENDLDSLYHGYIFDPFSETNRLSTRDYGTTYVSYSFVRKMIEKNNLGSLIDYYPQKLCNLQDIFVIRKGNQDHNDERWWNLKKSIRDKYLSIRIR